jgi:hypothetical protein
VWLLSNSFRLENRLSGAPITIFGIMTDAMMMISTENYGIRAILVKLNQQS